MKSNSTRTGKLINRNRRKRIKKWTTNKSWNWLQSIPKFTCDLQSHKDTNRDSLPWRLVLTRKITAIFILFYLFHFNLINHSFKNFIQIQIYISIKFLLSSSSTLIVHRYKKSFRLKICQCNSSRTAKL